MMQSMIQNTIGKRSGWYEPGVPIQTDMSVVDNVTGFRPAGLVLIRHSPLPSFVHPIVHSIMHSLRFAHSFLWLG